MTDDRPMSECRESFVAKVQALARTQQLFFETGRASLDSVVRGELAGFPDQLSVDGVDVSLTPVAAQNFTLIVHELAVNALKHGALALTAKGRRISIIPLAPKARDAAD